MAPPGCQAIVHTQAIGQGGTQGSWENRGQIGHCVGPTMTLCRVWQFCMPDAKAMIESDAAEFFPRHPMPLKSAATEELGAIEHSRKTINDQFPNHTGMSKSDALVDVL